MMISMTLREATVLADHAHHGQRDKAGWPYIEHVLAVRDMLAEYGEHAQMAGVLHDILEDTDVTVEDLRARGCPEQVIAAVESVTRREGETYDELIARAAADPIGRMVKLADNTHNSDEARLSRLPTEKAERLRAKYARAREVLRAPRIRGMTVEEVLALPVSFDLRTAGRAYGMGETKTRELVRSGEFPLKPLRLGNAYRFRRCDLLDALGIGEDQEQTTGGEAT